MIKGIFNYLIKPRVRYDPLVKIFLYKEALLHNYRTYQKQYPNLQIAPVLKSNAYGHGLVEVASVLDQANLPFFAVDSFYEALTLRQHQVKSKILVIGYTREALMLKPSLQDVSFAILSFESLKNLSDRLQRPNYFHLKIDTGLHRQGILMEEAPEAIKLLKHNPNIILEGLGTHFADAKSSDAASTKLQIRAWNDVVKIFKTEFASLKFTHAAATAGIYHSSETEANTARIGLGLYGLDNSPAGKLDLKMALEMRSVISGIKNIKAGEKVGYNFLFTADSPKKIATVPAGYNEGVDLRLTNQGIFQVQGQNCRITGRVSMNITTIDISAVSAVNLEDEVVIISRDSQATNSVENIAKICHTIPYEMLIHIPAYLRREII